MEVQERRSKGLNKGGKSTGVSAAGEETKEVSYRKGWQMATTWLY